MQLSEGFAQTLLAIHSGWRYIILILLILAIIYGYNASKAKRPFAGATKKFGMFTMIAADIQLLGGLLLYVNFVSVQTKAFDSSFGDLMGESFFRSIAVEHLFGMVVALILIHIGYAKAKKASSDVSAGKKQFTYFLIALIIILLSIPWPFIQLHEARGWF